MERLQQVLADLKESGANETKSTAGDKHETALAMLQLEQEKVRNQLAETRQQLSALQLLRPQEPHRIIAAGSLVKSGDIYFYVSIGAGKARIEENNVIAISPQSPLGAQLLTKQAGQTVVLQQNSYTIDAVY